MSGQVMNFTIEDENMPKLQQRLHDKDEQGVINIAYLLPAGKASHVFIRPSAVSFMAVEPIPEILTLAKKVIGPN